jgi:hypothetical protein
MGHRGSLYAAISSANAQFPRRMKCWACWRGKSDVVRLFPGPPSFPPLLLTHLLALEEAIFPGQGNGYAE